MGESWPLDRSNIVALRDASKEVYSVMSDCWLLSFGGSDPVGVKLDEERDSMRMRGVAPGGSGFLLGD